ncbi:MAG TPA: hypothetical protein VMZ30_22370 [Pyrinomonadaceae bacterium]|nr:hypothetical protein [Pyrinomonadaceae bacterium]
MTFVYSVIEPKGLTLLATVLLVGIERPCAGASRGIATRSRQNSNPLPTLTIMESPHIVFRIILFCGL